MLPRLCYDCNSCLGQCLNPLGLSKRAPPNCPVPLVSRLQSLLAQMSPRIFIGSYLAGRPCLGGAPPLVGGHASPGGEAGCRREREARISAEDFRQAPGDLAHFTPEVLRPPPVDRGRKMIRRFAGVPLTIVGTKSPRNFAWCSAQLGVVVFPCRARRTARRRTALAAPVVPLRERRSSTTRVAGVSLATIVDPATVSCNRYCSNTVDGRFAMRPSPYTSGLP